MRCISSARLASPVRWSVCAFRRSSSPEEIAACSAARFWNRKLAITLPQSPARCPPGCGRLPGHQHHDRRQHRGSHDGDGDTRQCRPSRGDTGEHAHLAGQRHGRQRDVAGLQAERAAHSEAHHRKARRVASRGTRDTCASCRRSHSGSSARQATSPTETASQIQAQVAPVMKTVVPQIVSSVGGVEGQGQRRGRNGLEHPLAAPGAAHRRDCPGSGGARILS